MPVDAAAEAPEAPLTLTVKKHSCQVCRPTFSCLVKGSVVALEVELRNMLKDKVILKGKAG